MSDLFLGWDVGAWNCDQNRKSRDALCAIEVRESGPLVVGRPWRGNVRDVLVAEGDALIAALMKLLDVTVDDWHHLTIAIDTPLGWPTRMLDLVRNGSIVVEVQCGGRGGESAGPTGGGGRGDPLSEGGRATSSSPPRPPLPGAPVRRPRRRECRPPTGGGGRGRSSFGGRARLLAVCGDAKACLRPQRRPRAPCPPPPRPLCPPRRPEHGAVSGRPRTPKEDLPLPPPPPAVTNRAAPFKRTAAYPAPSNNDRAGPSEEPPLPAPRSLRKVPSLPRPPP